MKPILIGAYQLGFRCFRLYIDPSTANSHVDLTPNDKGACQIFVGVNCPWGEAVGVLLHELYEASFIDLNVRYKKRPSYSNESSDYLFVMTHNELGEAHERIGDALAASLASVTIAYKKYSKFKS